MPAPKQDEDKGNRGDFPLPKPIRAVEKRAGAPGTGENLGERRAEAPINTEAAQRPGNPESPAAKWPPIWERVRLTCERRNSSELFLVPVSEARERPLTTRRGEKHEIESSGFAT